MMKRIQFILPFIAGITLISSCSKEVVDDPLVEAKSISLNISGLENLGNDFVYEGWLIVNNAPVSTGTFTVDASGNMSQDVFELNKSDVDAATKFVLSIEPVNDPDPAPSATKILAGDFVNSSASLDISPVGNFDNISGKYILATPTDGMGNNEGSGIWFLDLTSAGPAVGLELPVLPEGWKYEGWVVLSGQPVSSGTFTNVAGTDMADPYSDTIPLPDVNGADGFFPGEDFLHNAPANLMFPTNLTGATVVISIEPSPDNSPAPFGLKPLVDEVPAGPTPDPLDHVVFDMDTNKDFPFGTVTR